MAADRRSHRARKRGGPMSVVLVLSADPVLREHVAACARQAGVHLSVCPTIGDARPGWPTADLVFLGADLIRATVQAGLGRPKLLHVLTRDPQDTAAWDLATEAAATYVVYLPVGSPWLTEQLAVLDDQPVDQLRKAGFRVSYADPADAVTGSVSCWDLLAYADRDRGAVCPFVSLDEVACGEDRFGQSTTVRRSNYRTLRAAHPGVFTDVRYDNVSVLGAFVADLPPDLVDTVIGLREQYPLLDDADHSALEEEDITASWNQFVSQDVFALLGDRAQDVWTALPDRQVEDLWWDVVGGVGYRPEHDGTQVRWDLDQLAGPFAARLMAQFRRTYHPDPRFQILTLPPGRRPGPRFAVAADGFPFLFTVAWSRFSARTQLWKHQTAWQTHLNGAQV